MITAEEQTLRQLRVNVADLAYAISRAVEVYASSFEQDTISDLDRMVKEMGTLALDGEVYESMDSFHNIMNALHDRDQDRAIKSDAEEMKELRARQADINKRTGSKSRLTHQQMLDIIANRKRLRDEWDEDNDCFDDELL